MPWLSLRSRIRSRICACTVTSSAVVGSSAISTSGRLASAMAIITRWRWPPESWCGYWRSRASGSGMCTSLEQRQRALAGLGAGDAVVQAEHFGDLAADRVDRVQRAHRLLEDHRDARCRAARASRGSRSASDVLASEGDAGRFGDRGALGEQPHDGARGHRLARAAFADDGDRLAAMELEGDVAHRLDGAALDLEVDADVAGVEDRARGCRSRGRCASRRRRGSASVMASCGLNRDRSRRAGRRPAR